MTTSHPCQSHPDVTRKELHSKALLGPFPERFQREPLLTPCWKCQAEGREERRRRRDEPPSAS